MDGGIIETPQYAENERPTGNEFESILQEVFLSYKNRLALAPVGRKMGVWTSARYIVRLSVYDANHIIVYYGNTINIKIDKLRNQEFQK